MTIDRRTQKTMKALEKISGQKLTFGKLLWSIRMCEEQNQIEFSELLGISKQYLCDIEHGRRFPSVKSAIHYADVLGHSKQQFIRLCLQDLVLREGIESEIDIKFIRHGKQVYSH